MYFLSSTGKQKLKKLLGPQVVSKLKKYLTRQNVLADDNFIVGIEGSWSNDSCVGISGWIIGKEGPLDNVTVEVDGVSKKITDWIPRPDLMKEYSKYLTSDKCGFSVTIPHEVKHELKFKVKKKNDYIEKSVLLGATKTLPVVDVTDGTNIFNEFVEYVNKNRLRVLEIGSRVVSPGSKSKRELFPEASSYVGFDYYPDSNTDVVGDAHELSKYFNNQKFDAIFSVSVLEHIAMPWKLALEISKILEIGGVTCHTSHHSWPLHESPWDFWRFSDESLKVLFSPVLGFETIKAGLFSPIRMYAEKVSVGQELLPLHYGYGGSCIYTKKKAEIDFDRFNWNVRTEDVLGQDHHYPEPE